jgi:hypothetical protein
MVNPLGWRGVGLVVRPGADSVFVSGMVIIKSDLKKWSRSLKSTTPCKFEAVAVYRKIR